MTMLEAALDYSKRGMAVFPIAMRDKTPLTATGFKEASKDPDKIKNWWGKWPNANIGIATGNMSGGIHVIDLDIDDEKGVDGYQSLNDWQKEYGYFPDSWMVKTGRGGYHIYFHSTHPVKSRIGILEGVDIRGDGGYVVAPPSIHSNGNSYDWESNWEDLDIANDDILLDKLIESTTPDTSSVENFVVPDIIPTGQRNNFLFKTACSFQSKGLPDKTILTAILEINKNQCNEPLGEDEVEQLVSNVLGRYEKGKPIPKFDEMDPEQAGPSLRCTTRGTPYQYTENVIEVLEHDPEIKGSICYNTLAYAPYIRGPLPWDKSGDTREWNNVDDASLCNFVESKYELTNRTKIMEALDIVMNRYRFNPVQDLLEVLYAKWDKTTGHIKSLLPDYMGVKENIYSTECMTLFMLGAITRIYHPGAKFDYMPVLVGKQGIGKSTFFRYLAMNDKWYDDNFNTVESQQASEKLRGMWMVEMAELLATKRAKEVESIKSFLTSTSDNYRQPYARRSEQRPRMCVFAGTTNSDSFLTDRTGNRRFLPLVVREEHIKKSLFNNEAEVTADIQNAWGEAMDLFKKAGGKPKLTLSKEATIIANEEQARFTEEDTRVGIIQDWLDHTMNTRVCAGMLWWEALEYNIPPTRRDSNEILAIMTNEIEGWTRMPKKARCGKYGSTICFEKNVDNNSINSDEDDDPFMELDENFKLPFD